MGAIVTVVCTPIRNNVASSGHWDDDLLRGGMKSGAQQSMKATFTSPETFAIIPLKFSSEASPVTAAITVASSRVAT